MEIERKFLISAPPSDLDRYASRRIEQGYISTDPTIRIRRQDETYILTVKGKGRLAHEEFELPLTAESYARLMTKVEGRMIVKTRHLIPIENDLTIELDHFESPVKGLWLAEVEFPDIKTAEEFMPPAWLIKDVTDDPAYYNSAMSRLPEQS